MININGGINKVLVAVICGLPVIAGGGLTARADVTSDQVRAAIQDGIATIKQAQNANGSWNDTGAYKGGITALSLLALLNAGVPASDPAVRSGLDYLANLPNQHTYVVSLKCQVFNAAGAKQYANELRQAAEWLILAQSDVGTWTYTGRAAGNRPLVGRGDNSNTQFALLGLHEAAKGGVDIPLVVWEKSKKYFENTQGQDGGWPYVFSGPGRAGVPNTGPSTPTMTAAGEASLFICGQRLNVGGKKQFINGAYPDCGKYTQNAALAAGIQRMAVQMGNGFNVGGWGLYYLYGLERVGMISGLKNFGAHDWYREGADFLVNRRRGRGGGAVNQDDSFAVLFLAKGNRPLLYQKVQWNSPKNPSEWNRNIHDLDNLCAWINDVPTRAKEYPNNPAVASGFGKAVTWQATTLAMPLEQLRISPVLLITGHDFPVFTPDEKTKLQGFIDAGGTLLFEACCGSENFKKGFTAFAEETWPLYKKHVLDPTHPVFSCMYKITDTYDLEGIDVGCRTSIFFSPKALCCLWELQTIQPWSKQAYELGANIAAYATGREALPDKLDKIELPEAAKNVNRQPEVPRGAVRIARLAYGNEYTADPHMEENLAALLRDKAKVDVVAKSKYLQATDPALYDYPVIFMTGHFSFTLSKDEQDALRLYLQRGGVLIADACCGRKPFDTSFREMCKQLFAENPLTALPANHPIYSGKFGLPLGEVKYRPLLAEELKSRGTTQPPIESVTIQGRTVIMYSKYDFSCALEGDNPYSCLGYMDEDGKKIGINLFLYAISY